ncbi:MAG: SMC-Scp complex subunit ScpB [Verrucomicrobiota bacterium]|nr:SMC-Scp complex subunit ScpB [Verrucomicrobiota bacterium]
MDDGRADGMAAEREAQFASGQAGSGGTPMAEPEVSAVLEALLFAAPKPLSLQEIRKALQEVVEEHLEGDAAADEEDAVAAAPSTIPDWAIALAAISKEDLRHRLEELARSYRLDLRRGFQLVEVAEGFQLVTKPAMAIWLQALLEDRKKGLLTRAALETLAIIAYRQPVTRADVEEVRGVSVDGVMRTLLEKGLIRILGKSDLPGRPMLYETGPLFLEHFGLRSVQDLPAYMELSRAAVRTESKAAEWMGNEASTGKEEEGRDES